MQTADIAKSTQCWCERILAADLGHSAPAQMIFQHPLNALLPLMPFSARSAPLSAPLTLRSHAVIVSDIFCVLGLCIKHKSKPMPIYCVVTYVLM